MANDFSKLADIYSSNVNAAMVQVLADDLGVKPESLVKLGVGYHPTYASQAFTFPERNSSGEVIGISVRHESGKLMIKGSKRGLFYQLDPGHESGVNAYEPGEHNWTRVSEEIPCPVCGKFDGCLVASRNPSDPPAVVCVRVPEGSTKELELGFLHILKPEGNVSKGASGPLPGSDLPVIVVEGASDAAAALDLGFVAVGRPSAEGGTAFLPDLLRGRDVIVVGDNDAGAGVKGMESAFHALSSVCERVVKVLPPKQFKDLRQWKRQMAITQKGFLEWVAEEGDSSGSLNLLASPIAYDIAKEWLDREMLVDDLPTVRNFRGQWLRYHEGAYHDCDKEEFRGLIYRYLNGKHYPNENKNGDVDIIRYQPTRAKVSDIIDALSDWCMINQDMPSWLTDIDRPEPKDLVAFQNGILDINEYVKGKIKMYDPTPAYFSQNILPYDFDEDAESTEWNNFIGDIFNNDKSKIALLSQWFGYNCVPDMSQEKLLLCTGRPRSGKGTVLNTLAAMLGYRQCVSTSFQTLCTEFGYQPLVGKLAVLLGDAKVPHRREASAALEKILQVVGNDPVGVRRMYLPYLPHIYLTCRFTIAMNDLPNIPDQANALEPRLNLLSFENSYVGREDRQLKSRLQKEARAGKLINFALRGLKSLRQDGIFAVPRATKKLLDEMRELTTPVTAFVLDCCDTLAPPDLEYYVTIDHAYKAWQKWCEDNGTFTGSKSQFGRNFMVASPHITVARVRIDGVRHRVYTGIKLSDWVFFDWFGVERVTGLIKKPE